jgi:hypothetical protein
MHPETGLSRCTVAFRANSTRMSRRLQKPRQATEEKVLYPAGPDLAASGGWRVFGCLSNRRSPSKSDAAESILRAGGPEAFGRLLGLALSFEMGCLSKSSVARGGHLRGAADDFKDPSFLILRSIISLRGRRRAPWLFDGSPQPGPPMDVANSASHWSQHLKNGDRSAVPSLME